MPFFLGEFCINLCHVYHSTKYEFKPIFFLESLIKWIGLSCLLGAELGYMQTTYSSLISLKRLDILLDSLSGSF